MFKLKLFAIMKKDRILFFISCLCFSNFLCNRRPGQGDESSSEKESLSAEEQGRVLGESKLGDARRPEIKDMDL